MADVHHHPEPKLSRNLSFHFLWSSTFASGFADRLAMLAVAVMLGYGAKDEILQSVRLADASITAGYNFWFFLPYVIWGPFAGWLADRLPRKWLMFVSDQARGLIILLAFTMIPRDRSGAIAGLYDTWITIGGIEFTHTWKIWLMMFSIGLFAATFGPARNSVIPNVVGYAALQRANAVVLGLGVIGNLLGFPVGGYLSENLLRGCVLISALMYLIPGWMWPFLKTPVRRTSGSRGAGKAKPSRSLMTVFKEVGDGGKYILHHRPLIALAAASVVFWSGSHIIIAAGSAIVTNVYGGDISDFALIGGGFGLGMLAGAILLGAMNARWGSEILISAGMIGAAIFLSLLVVVPSLYAGLVLSLLCGFCGGVLMITINTMVQQCTADCFRGRVMAFKDLASDLGAVIVSGIIWQMANADQAIVPVAHGFSALLIIAAIWGLWRFVFRGPAPTRWGNFLYRLFRFFVAAVHKVKYAGKHHVPQGAAILVCKHTAGVDPVLVQCCLPRVVRWMMAIEQRTRWLNWFWAASNPIGVKRDGTDRNGARHAIAALKEGELLGLFPEGHLPEYPGEVKKFGLGVSVLASRSGAPIVPVWVSGTPHTKSVYGSFIRLSQSRVTFGKAFTLDELDVDTNDRRAVVDAIRAKVEMLGEQVEAGDLEYR